MFDTLILPVAGIGMAFLFAGFVKGVVGLGLPTVTIGLLSLAMPPAEAAVLLVILFLNVVEAGSVTHGAGRTHLALASASARIRGMEEVLGVALPERGRRGVRPIPAGQALGPPCRPRAPAGRADAGRTRQIRPWSLGMCPGAGEHRRRDRVPARPARPLSRRQPEHRHRSGGAAQLRDRAGRRHGGCRDRDRRRHGGSCRVEIFPFRVDCLVLVFPKDGPKDGPFSGRRRIAFSEVAGHEFIGLAAGSALQEHLAARPVSGEAASSG